jgi:dTDP-4-dehydrorhamnose reductase
MNHPPRRLLLTGANGLLGSALREDAAARGLPFVALPHEGLLARARTLDITADDVLVHAAANTNVEACEREPGACYRDNLLLTEALARRAARTGTRLVFISSTGVYGNAKATPYTEFDEALPTTHHHRSKWLAEQAVLGYCPEALVLRTGWLFGGQAENPKNFVARRIDEARAAAGGSLQSNAVQRGNPTSTADFVAQLWRLLDDEHCGLFNVVASGSASRCEYVAEIVRLAGLPVDVLPTLPAHFKRLAQVSDNETAENLKARLLGLPEMPHWRDSLARYVHALAA